MSTLQKIRALRAECPSLSLEAARLAVLGGVTAERAEVILGMVELSTAREAVVEAEQMAAVATDARAALAAALHKGGLDLRDAVRVVRVLTE